MGILKRLKARQSRLGEAPIAIIGAGYVARGVVHTLFRAPGMRPAIIVNRTTEHAVAIYESLGILRQQIVISNEKSSLTAAISAGKPCVAESFEALDDLPIELVVEATGALDYGTRAILASLDAGRHVVSFNAEVDSLLGWQFHQRAKANDVIYTIADGDQPGVLLRLAEQVESMGFEVRTMLNCKRYLNVLQNPSSGAGYASRDTTSSHMTTAFGDGTKMQVEQAVVANATGMVPDKRGMWGMETSQEKLIDDLPEALIDGSKVDYTLGGDFGAGVGVVARHEDVHLHKKSLALYKMGDGPDYFFFRPYHLVHLELPMTIADVLLDNEPLSEITEPHAVEVVAITKKTLSASEKLDGIGGYSAYGHIDRYMDAFEFLPIGLSEFATTTEPLPEGEAIPLTSVSLDDTKEVVRQWRSQRQHWAKLREKSARELEVQCTA